MNNFKTIAMYIGLCLGMMLLISVMMIQFLKAAFPKAPIMDARIPIMKERATCRSH